MSAATGQGDDEVRRRLLHLRAAVEGRLAGVTTSRSDVVDAARGANVDDEHDPEGATIAFERAQLEALAGDARSALAEVDAALSRLADGTYGICAVGGEPIPPERLAVRPTATTCVQHAGG